MLTIKQITIDSCNFTNSLLNDGYYLYSTLSNFNIKNCNFINNTINQANIGQIYSLIRMGSSVNISNTVFMSNYLVNTTLISINNDNTVEEKIVIISNKVLILYNTQILEMALAFMIVGKNLKVFIQDNVTFQYNFAHSSFLYISDTLSCLLIEDMFLINNFGFEMVSLQLLSNITITRMHCENNNDFSYNYYRINNIINTPGNCLSIVNYVNLYLQNSIFSKNFAESTLTGILLEHTPNLDLLGVQTNQTKAYFEKIVCNENVVNATLDNLITNGNCFLLINSGTTTIINCVISYNINNVNLDVEYSGNPCLISLSNDNNLHIIDSIFVGNQAYSECSCLNFQGTNFLLKNVSFIENRSIKMQIGNDPPMFYVDNEGGCMNLGAENITMNDVRIYNSSALKGAGIFFHNKNSKKFQYLDVFNMSIIKNEGIQTSGIEFDASLIVGEYVFTNCVINENYVEFYGVISTFYFTGFNIYFYNSDISFNWGITAGAAFSFYHFTGEFFINQSTLIGNVLNQSVFVGGAALFLYGATRNTVVYVTATKFINNTSSLKGGAIQSMYGNVIVRDSEFIDNSALYGGAISIAIYCPSSFINVIVRSSKRSIQGGAFHFREHAYIL